MNVTLLGYSALALAVILEVAGSVFLQRTEQFTRLVPTVITAILYTSSFYSLTHALKVMPLSIAYAIWGGVGIILTTGIACLVFRQEIDTAAVIGISLIVTGVFVINIFSHTSLH